MPKINIELESFSVPNFVRMKPPITTSRTDLPDIPGIPLSEVDSVTLETLCDEFRDAVFTKAGKPRPPQQD